VSVYSRTDGVVDWRACLDPGAEHVEVRASHCGMAVNASTYEVLARALADFRESARARERRRAQGRREARPGARQRRGDLRRAA
jgi:hypothetical protein